jgi:hypothetical protein
MRISWAVLLLLSAWIGLRPAQAQTPPDPVNLTALWYDQSQAGHGLNVVHQGSILFAAWYVYGADGKVLWMISAATRQADGRYVGAVNSFDGQPFNLINNAQAFTNTHARGEARLSLGADGKLDFDYTIDNIPQTRRLERAQFVANAPVCSFTTGSRASATNYTDVWWQQAESGWGVSIIHQGDLIFIAWYTYGADGKAMWVTGLATRQADGSYSGDLNRPASGTPFNQINGPATAFPVPTVGSFSLRFSDGENASFSYTLDGVTQTKPISRLVFVGDTTPVTVCADSTGGGGGGGGASLTSCDPGLNAGDFRTNRTDNGNGDVTERVIGPGTFQGQSAIVLDQFDASGTLTNRTYMQVTESEIRTLGNEAFQNGAVLLTTVFNPPAKFIRVPAINETYTHSYTGTSTGPGLSYTTQYQETIKREADEVEDSPVGSYNSCKFKRTIATTTFGINATVDMDLWLAPQLGTIRSRVRTSTPGSPPEILIELIRARVNGIDYGN